MLNISLVAWILFAAFCYVILSINQRKLYAYLFFKRSQLQIISKINSITFVSTLVHLVNNKESGVNPEL